jgi:hypothetical protein
LVTLYGYLLSLTVKSTEISKSILGAGFMAARLLWLFIAVSTFSPITAWTQANVNESQESVFIYVNGSTGLDANPGTQAAPLKTIAAAAARATTNNHNGAGTRVIISPGTYRESVLLGAGSSNTTAPITVQAATNGTVIISGAQLLSNWQPYVGNTSIFINAWPNRWGNCPTYPSGPYEPPIVLRREMIIVNGVPLTQVLALSQMATGTFYVDEAQGHVYIWPAPGTNMSSAVVEAAALPSLFTIQGKTNVVLRGLTFKYAASCRSKAAVTVQGSTNVLLDTVNFLWNNAQGLAVSYPSASFTVQNSVANHNGENGFQAYRVKYGLWQSNDASFNNWRGAQGSYYYFNSGGGHFFQTHNQSFSGFTAFYNQTYGAHFDTDHTNISATNFNASQNLLNGLFIEKDQGPFTVTGGNYCNNNPGVHPQSVAEGGISVRNSSNVALSGNTLYNNGQAQITIQGQKGGIVITNWETGQSLNLLTTNLKMSSNVSVASGTQVVFSNSYLGGTDWTAFASTLSSNYNTWWNTSTTSAFNIPTPKAGTHVSISGWRSATGQDMSSQVTPPQNGYSSMCQPAPDAPDFWLQVDNPTLSVSAGGQLTFNFTLSPQGMGGTVQLLVDGINQMGAGTATLSNSSVSLPAVVQMRLVTGSPTPAGRYPLTLIATNGSMTRTATVYVTVQ